MKNKIVIGIDQSYKDTGVTISYNGIVKKSFDICFKDLNENCMKRNRMRERLNHCFNSVRKIATDKCADVIVIIERIRLRSQGFINIDYIKSIGALNALIVDEASKYLFPVYSVDTRAWKSSIVGTSKEKTNPYKIDPKKFPTILWCIKNGYKKYIIDYDVGKKKNGVIEKSGERYTYNDNIADSICISLYGFIPESQQLLKEEK